MCPQYLIRPKFILTQRPIEYIRSFDHDIFVIMRCLLYMYECNSLIILCLLRAQETELCIHTDNRQRGCFHSKSVLHCLYCCMTICRYSNGVFDNTTISQAPWTTLCTIKTTRIILHLTLAKSSISVFVCAPNILDNPSFPSVIIAQRICGTWEFDFAHSLRRVVPRRNDALRSGKLVRE